MTGDTTSFNQDSKALNERLDIAFALEAAQLGVWELDPVTQLINWDKRCGELFGLTDADLIPYEQAIRYIHPDDVNRVDKAIKWAMNPQSGGAYDITHRTIGASDGLLRWVRFTGRGYFTDARVVYRFAGIAQDVTKDVQTQQVEASHERFRTMVEQAPVAIAVFRGDNFVFDSVNDAYLPLIDKTRDDVLGKPLFDVLPETKAVLEPLARELVRTGIPFPASEFEVVINRSGRDETCYFNSVWEPLRRGDGGVDGFMVVAHEVTEQVLTRKKVEESELRFRSLIEEAPVATCLLMGRELIVAVANDVILGYWGKDRSVLGKSLAEAIPELKGQPFLQILDDVFSTGNVYEAKAARAELKIAGVLSTYYFDYTYKPLRNAAGEIYAIMDTAVDVTKQVMARQKLEESEQYFRQLTDIVPAILWITEPDGYCSYLNKQWYDYTGQTEAAAKGFGWLEATHPDDKEDVGQCFVDANRKRESFSALYRLRHKNGSYRWAIDKGSPRFAINGDYLGMIGTVVDVHEQKLAEEGLTQFKYMADNASDPFILMREDGTFAYLNKLALDRWGYTPEEAQQIRVPDVDPIYNDAVFGSAFARAQQEKIHPFETLHRTKDGVIYPVEVNMGGLILGQQPYLFAVARDISERKKAEQALREREVLFRNVTKSSPTGLWLSDEAGGLTYLNNTLVDWTGLPYEALLGAGWATAIVEEDRQRSAEVFLKAVDTRTHYDTLFRIEKGDGRIIWCQAAGDPYYREDGSYAGYAGYCMDIDEQVKQRQAIEASEARLRSVISTAPAAMGLFVSRDLVVEMPNQAFIDMVGKGPNIVGKPLREVMPELESQVFLRILDDVYTSGQMFQSVASQVDIVQHGVMTHNFYNITYTPLFDDEGNVYAILDIAIDVTDEIKARQQLEESELFSRSIIENSPVAKVVFVGEDMVIRTVNENMLAMLGRDASIIGKPFMEAMPELMLTPLMDRLRHVFTTGETYYQPEERLDLIRYGQPYTGYYSYVYKALQDTTGAIYGIITTASEVTKQVQTRLKIEEAEINLRGAIELAELGTWELDVATGITRYSERMKSWFGFASEAVDPNTVYNLIHTKDRSRVEAAIGAALLPGSAGIYDEEYTIVESRTGYERIIHAQGKTFFDERGNPLKIIGTANDVTEQREIELALQQLVQERTEELAATNEELAATNEELAATNEELAVTNQELTDSNQLLVRSNENLQQFAYIASHDLQEPLRKIQSFGDLLKNRYASELGEGVGHLERMQTAASRMSTLIRDLLAFSRISTQQDSTERVDLARVVNAVLVDLDLRIQETGARVDIAPLPAIQGDRVQLSQLFQNLLSNALKFSRVDPSGAVVSPRIRVGFRTVAHAELPASVKPARLTTTYHRIDVTDNGIGFDDKYVDRIFQVFQRLHGKSEFAGTGIGLAICAKVAANHGGAITATSQPGEGATFSVYFPA